MLVVPALWLLHWVVVCWEWRVASRQSSPEQPAQPSAFPITPLNGPLLLLTLMVLVSLWATYDIAISLPKVSGMVLGLGVYFAVVRAAERPHGYFLSLLAYLGLGLGIAALGVIATGFTSKITLLDPLMSRLPRFITGLKGLESGFHPNEVAGALIWVLPLMMVISVTLFLPRPAVNENAGVTGTDWFEKLRGWRWLGVTCLSLAATFFSFVVFLLCQSRGAYIGLSLSLPLLILFALPRGGRRVSLAALAVLAVALGLLLASNWAAARTWITGNDLAADPALSLGSLEGRVEVWSRAIYAIQDFPFTGLGMNIFRKVLPVLYPLFLVSPDIDIGHAHNEFLQAALDLGLPGLIAFLALYIGAFWMLAEIWSSTRQLARNPELYTLVTRSLALGLGGGLLAHLLYGLTDAVALGAKPGMLFWMLLGLIAGLRHQAQQL